ncbi:MAG TPA: SRPBCC family protein [Actinomycetota bacterium]
MSKIEESIDVMVPVHVAYNQWTQFEDFPKFMEGVEQVHQLDDTKLHWRAKVAGQEREWDARITEQKPDDRIAWTSIDGAPNGGVVTFHELEGDTTRVMLQLEFDPEGLIEKTGDALGLVKGRTKGDLDRFKEYVEKRGTETGAWRGEVEQGATKSA